MSVTVTATRDSTQDIQKQTDDNTIYNTTCGIYKGNTPLVDIEALNNKIQLVSTLPATQTNGVLYVIPE